LHTVPSIWQVVVVVAQVPATAPAEMEQTPVQHSLSPRQISPAWAQYETAPGEAHWWSALQVLLQHSESLAQVLPEVLQV
jgi:hypothetical protein